MTLVRELTRFTVLGTLAAGTFLAVNVYLTAKQEIAAEAGEVVAPRVALADKGPVASVSSLTPLTAVEMRKYPQSALAPPKHEPKILAEKQGLPEKKVAAVKPKAPVRQVARVATQAPLQLASSNESISYGYAPEPPPPRAQGLFDALFARN